MRVTDTTIRALKYRRFAKKMRDDGYEEVAENGHPLWQFRRGGRTREIITDAKVDPAGYSVWIKAEKVES